MGRPMESVEDLIEEAKVRTVCWGLCVFAISYFLTHTSKSMWTNVPMSILILAFIRYISFKVEFRWRGQPVHKQTYLSQLSKRQLSASDHRLSTVPPVPRWKRKVGSPSVEAAFESFIEKVLRDFVVDLWYSSITPDREAPELIRSLILHCLGELSGRVKEINLVDLLIRDMVDLMGDHLEIYRKNQSQIGVDVIATLSSEERDERLKQHLILSKELHPALLSSEHEYKVLQQIVGGVLSLTLRPQDAQSPLVRCFSRELLTCLVVQPAMNFASPIYLNELIIYLLNNKDTSSEGGNSLKTNTTVTMTHDHLSYKGDSKGCQMESRNLSAESGNLVPGNSNGMSSVATYEGSKSKESEDDHGSAIQHRQPDWAMVLDAATKRRSQVLAPENLENMWAIGRNYQKKMMKVEHSSRVKSSGGIDNVPNAVTVGKELSPHFNERITSIDDKYMVNLMQGLHRNVQSTFASSSDSHVLHTMSEVKSKEGAQLDYNIKEESSKTINSTKGQLKRSNSTPDMDTRCLAKSSETMVSKENLNTRKNHDEKAYRATSHGDVLLYVPKIRCRVVGAYFEKLGSKSFAVYSIAVSDADNKTWFVKRRYRNFECLHRQLKEIPNYLLHLPPKSFLSSSIDDYLVHQRCILLDKYLQDLLSIPNIAEQHEVWDFLSASSKNYSSGKSASVMKTLAVNVDDAMDDIVRQFKGVSDGLKRVVGTSPSSGPSQLTENRMALSWNQEETDKHILHHINLETARSLSDDDSNYESRPSSVTSGCHSDNEMNNRGYASSAIRNIEAYSSLDSQRSQQLDRPAMANFDSLNMASLSPFEDPAGIPPEWMPTNVSVPLLNLVEKVFQLKRRGWIRRQVLWISKQILQLVMEDAIDDWILRQINWLRKDDVIAQGICWIQDTLWPNGTFFTRLDGYQGKTGESQFDKHLSGNANQAFGNRNSSPSSFELQLEASRRASEVKKLLLGGTPATLVSIIGYKQYRRSARDMYYFLQSTVCLKQLGYAMLEQVLVSVFPELQQLIHDIHEGGRKEQGSLHHQL